MRASHQKTLHRRRWREDNYSFSQKEKVFFWQSNISLIFDCHRCLNYCNESFFPSRRLTFWASTICLEPLLGCVSSKLQGRISENEWMIFFYNLDIERKQMKEWIIIIWNHHNIRIWNTKNKTLSFYSVEHLYKASY